MTVILLMIPISLLLSLGFMAAFLWANRNGQYESIDLEAYKILDPHPRKEESHTTKPETQNTQRRIT
ncbi:MAG: cbb3-type cytochrome oxidase assembly protein CcoS [Bdellovibrionaceae bacterium]|jgi:cbb3-type cytochrome oxidase maturation protein|nr:cbb3-type cytochrome oxidase assembly protein CcoS [Pseudobdellovibrionaceae bacterium]